MQDRGLGEGGQYGDEGREGRTCKERVGGESIIPLHSPVTNPWVPDLLPISLSALSDDFDDLAGQPRGPGEAARRAEH